MIENGSPVDDPDVIDYVRTYSLLQLGLAPNVQEDQPAVTLDWMLKIHGAVVARQRREAAEAANG